MLTAYRPEFASREREQKLRHRLRETAKDNEQRRQQARIILWLVAATYLALLLLAFSLCLWGGAEQQKWALGALMTILGSILGYLVGRKS
ncbi:MAG TPA: hypothetical protein VE153_06340 [Myxococcus sp.]|nr:hypothetical protein [Myxococcus sp.]